MLAFHGIGFVLSVRASMQPKRSELDARRKPLIIRSIALRGPPAGVAKPYPFG